MLFPVLAKGVGAVDKTVVNQNDSNTGECATMCDVDYQERCTSYRAGHAEAVFETKPNGLENNFLVNRLVSDPEECHRQYRLSDNYRPGRADFANSSCPWRMGNAKNGWKIVAIPLDLMDQ